MSKALAAYQEEIKKELAGISSSISTSNRMERIRAENKAFIVPGQDPNMKPLEVVVVEFTNSYSYFAQEYDPTNPSNDPPVCTAVGKNIAEMKPRASSDEPQAEQCDGCQWNEYETASIGKGKRCGQSVLLAVLPPTASSTDTPMLLNVPAASITNWGNYVKSLAGKSAIPAMVVTEISFDPNVKWTKFNFRAIEETKNFEAVMAMRPEVHAAINS